MDDVVKDVKILFFADDQLIYVRGINAHEVIETLNKDLIHISDYFS